MVCRYRLSASESTAWKSSEAMRRSHRLTMWSNLDADACAQTADTLAQIDAVLEKQGSSKSRILDATIFLADGADFAAMNQAWDAWVVAGHAPVRCTVQAKLMNPKYKVEIKIIAAV